MSTPPQCPVDGCTAPAYRKRTGWCSRHYFQQLKGLPFTPHPATTLADRLWRDVLVRGADECWEWQRGRHGFGYGGLRWAGQDMKTHRVAWEVTHGSIPDGMFVCHRCDNPPCCNPAHLFLGTAADNNADRGMKDRTVAWKTKLTPDDVRQIRSLAATTPTGELATRFGINRQSVYNVIAGVTWKRIA